MEPIQLRTPYMRVFTIICVERRWHGRCLFPSDSVNLDTRQGGKGGDEPLELGKCAELAPDEH